MSTASPARSRRQSRDRLEYDARRRGAIQSGEVRLDGDGWKHLAQQPCRLPEVRDLALPQIGLEGADLAGTVPRAVLVSHGDDAARPVIGGERLEAAPEEIEVLGNPIAQRQRLDASRHGHEVRVGSGTEMVDRKV